MDPGLDPTGAKRACDRVTVLEPDWEEVIDARALCSFREHLRGVGK
jgi:hypothetical protein